MSDVHSTLQSVYNPGHRITLLFTRELKPEGNTTSEVMPELWQNKACLIAHLIVADDGIPPNVTLVSNVLG